MGLVVRGRVLDPTLASRDFFGSSGFRFRRQFFFILGW